MTKTVLTKAQIDAKKQQLAESIKAVASKKTSGRNTAAKVFLTEIEDLVKDSFEQGLTSRQLANQIYAVYNFKISEQTIKNFAIQKLGIDPSPKKKG